MINNDKWINSLPKINSKNPQEVLSIDHNKWLDTIPKRNTYSSVKKYSAITVLFIIGLLLIPIVKNETRNLEKEISYLRASIDRIEFNLTQAILDHEVITSPENISKLAKEHLNTDLTFYKKSQIKNLNGNDQISGEAKIKNKTINDLPENVKAQLKTKIKKKKEEIAKLKELYNDPRSIPGEIKVKVAKQIKEKKFELKSLYESPGDTFTLGKIGKWGVIQVVKAFLGMPVIPGR